jgi:photosystem II stability/assembly factor-like uncharacterized protein
MSWYKIAQNIGDVDTSSFIPLNVPFGQSLRAFVNTVGGLRLATSQDGGEHWDVTEKQISPINLHTKDSNNPDILYGYRFFPSGRGPHIGGLLKSINGGASWFDSTPPPKGRMLRFLYVSPWNGNHIYAIFSNSSMMSRDGGQSWDPVSIADKTDRLISFLADPIEANIVYAQVGISDLASQTTDYQFAKSIDLGKTWQVVGMLPFESAYSGINGPSFYIHSNDTQKLLMASRKHGVFMSKNGGKDWHPTHSGVRFFDADIVASNDSSIVYLLGRDKFYKSTDEGKTWNEFFFGKMLADLNRDGCSNNIALNPKRSNELVCPEEHTLFQSKDFGVSWKTIFSTSIKGGWTPEPIYAADGQTIYVVSDGDQISFHRSDDNGATWNKISNAKGAFIADSHDAKVIYNIDKVDGSVRLFQSTNTGEG